MVMLFDIFHMPGSVFSVVFATEQQAIVSKMLIEAMRKQNSSMNKSEMSGFANTLHQGIMIEKEIVVEHIKKIEQVKVSYNKRQFYDRILTPMKTMGMIDYDMTKKKYLVSDQFLKGLNGVGELWKKEVINNQ